MSRGPVIDINLRTSDGATRLQITADVDPDDITVLRNMLDKYEEILKLLEDTSETVWRPKPGEPEPPLPDSEVNR